MVKLCILRICVNRINGVRALFIYAYTPIRQNDRIIVIIFLHTGMNGCSLSHTAISLQVSSLAA